MNSFLWHEFFPVAWILSCGRNFIQWQEFHYCGRILLLWQEFPSCDMNIFPVHEYHSCGRNLFLWPEFHYNGWKFIHVAEILSCDMIVSCGGNFSYVSGICFCDRNYLPMTGILFLWPEFHYYGWNFIPVKVILSCGRNFIPVAGNSFLLQEFPSCGRNSIPEMRQAFYTCGRNCIPVEKCDIYARIWLQISCHILLISCGQCPRVHGEKNGLPDMPQAHSYL